MKARLLLVVAASLPLFTVSCAKRESVADREAEIDRRVQQRVEAEHQAAEKKQLAQREDELATREKALAAQENSFATMAASLAAEKTSAPEATPPPDADGSAPSPALADSGASGAIYPEQYGYVAPNESYVSSPTDSFASYQPYYFTSAVPVVTIVSRNRRFIYPCRPSFRSGSGRTHSGFPSAGSCQPGIRHPVITQVMPPQRTASRPNALPMTHQVSPRSNRATAAGARPQGR